MKKIIALLLALILWGCNESPTAPTSVTEVSSSSLATSSSSTTQYTEPLVSIETPVTALYVGEIGYVCTGFNTSAVQSYKATEGYMAMYDICGDRATMTTGTQPRTASVINDWIINDLKLTESFRILIVNDVNTFGSTLRFYDAVDGYLRYIYIEPYGDGKGLMKQNAN